MDILLSSVEELRQHGDALFRAHVREAEPEMTLMLAPDWEGYRTAERLDQLVVLGAWLSGRLVGYVVAAMVPNMHYEGFTVCQHDLLFVAPEWRGGRVGLRLIERLREEARDRGAKRLLMHAKPGSKLEALLPRLGFEVEEVVFREDL